MKLTELQQRIIRAYEDDRSQTSQQIADVIQCGRRTVEETISKVYGSINRIRDSWLVLADCHFPYGDKQCIDTIVEYARKERIENLMLLGDVFDFHEISRWGDKFRKTLDDEIDEATWQLKGWILDSLAFKRKVFIKGNHEHRLESYITNNARKIQNLLEKRGFDLPSVLGLEEMGFEYVDNNQLRVDTGSFFKLGKLYFLHGHEIKSTGKYPARNMISKVHDNVIFGHFHKTDEALEVNLSGKPSKCFSIGCSCNLLPDYMVYNSWNQGFAILKFKEDGFFSIENKIIHEGQVY